MAVYVIRGRNIRAENGMVRLPCCLKSGSGQREPQGAGPNTACLRNRKLTTENQDVENKGESVAGEVRREVTAWGPMDHIQPTWCF